MMSGRKGCVAGNGKTPRTLCDRPRAGRRPSSILGSCTASGRLRRIRSVAIFAVRNQCWAHILREADKLAIRNGGNGICHATAVCSPCTRGSREGSLPACARVPLPGEDLQSGEGHKFRGTLEGACPAPVHVPEVRPKGMPPHNNAAELEIRDSVVLPGPAPRQLRSEEGRSSRCWSRLRVPAKARGYFSACGGGAGQDPLEHIQAARTSIPTEGARHAGSRGVLRRGSSPVPKLHVFRMPECSRRPHMRQVPLNTRHGFAGCRIFVPPTGVLRPDVMCWQCVA